MCASCIQVVTNEKYENVFNQLSRNDYRCTAARITRHLLQNIRSVPKESYIVHNLKKINRNYFMQ